MKNDAAAQSREYRIRWLANATPEQIAVKRAKVSERSRAWSEANPGKAKARSAGWHKANREKQNSRRKEHYEANREAHLTGCKAYADANKEKIAAYKAQWFMENKARLKARALERRPDIYARTRQRRAEDAGFAMLGRLRSRMQKAVKACGGIRAKNVKALIGCAPADFVAHIEAQFLPDMTWENRSEWHLDHKLPCKHFDLTDPAQQSACFHYTNIRPLWGKDNQRKSAKVLPEFLPP